MHMHFGLLYDSAKWNSAIWDSAKRVSAKWEGTLRWIVQGRNVLEAKRPVTVDSGNVEKVFSTGIQRCYNF